MEIIARIALLLGGFFLLGLVGLGPALFLLGQSKKHRFTDALLLAPALGFAEAALILHPLVVTGNIPVDSSGLPVLIVCLLLSMALVWYDFRQFRREYDWSGLRRYVRRTRVIVPVICFFIAAVALLAPTFIGSWDYYFWQGNTVDATNYMMITWYVRHAPYSAADHPDQVLALEQRDPALMASMGLINKDRPAAEITLGWLTYLFDTPIYDMYHPYCLLMLLLMFPLTLAISREMGLPLWYGLGAALTLTLGFWGFVIIDSNATSQITALPIAALFLFTWMRAERVSPTSSLGRGRVLMALAFAAELTYYQEYMPVLTAAFLAYYGWQFIRHPRQGRTYIACIFSLAVLTTIITLPVLPYMLGRIGAQIVNNENASASLAKYYYSWLFDHRLMSTGLWGLTFFRNPTPANFEFQMFNVIMSDVLALTLTAIALPTIGWLLGQDSPLSILGMCAAAYVGACLVLYIIDWRWTSGKVFGMGYPFVTLALVYGIAEVSRRPGGIFGPLRPLYVPAVNGVLILWIGAQICTPIFRGWLHITNEAQIMDFIPVHRALDVGAPRDIINDIEKTPAKLLAVDFKGQFFVQAWAWWIVLGEHVPFYPLSSLSDRPDAVNLQAAQANALPDQLLLANDSDYGDGLLTRLYRTSSLTLYAVTPDDWDQLTMAANIFRLDSRYEIVTKNIDVPLILDGQQGYKRWMTGDGSTMRFLASGTLPMGLVMNYRPAYTGSFAVTLNGNPVRQMPVVTDQSQYIFACFMPKQGANVLTFSHTLAQGVDPSTIPAQHMLLNSFAIVPQDRVDVGSASDATSIISGWFSPESWPTETIRWAGKTAQFKMLTCSGGEDDRQLTFRAFLPDKMTQSVTITVNDGPPHTVTLQAGWHNYAVIISGLKSDQLQTITLTHAATTIPSGDSREVAAAYDWFAFAQP